jgi:transposase
MTSNGMKTFSGEFKREAVRLVQTRGRTIGQVAADLGIGHSTLGKWLTRCRVTGGKLRSRLCWDRWSKIVAARCGGKNPVRIPLTHPLPNQSR